MSEKRKTFLFLFFLVLLVLLYSTPFFRSGYFSTHDGEWAIIRLAEMRRELRDFQIPPRWSDYLNHGYGYPLFSFTYPLPYYMASLVSYAGAGMTQSIKIVFVLSFLASGFFMYFFGRSLAGSFAGFLVAGFYLVAPYRLVDLYIRGSLGESVSFAIFPFLGWMSVRYIAKPTAFRGVLASLSFALLLLSHNVMALVFFPFSLVFLLVLVSFFSENVWKYSWRYLIPMVLLGCGLAMYFVFPALSEKQFLSLSRVPLADVSQHFVSLPDYLFSPWRRGILPSFQLGRENILAAVIGFGALLFSSHYEKKKYERLGAFFFLSLLLLVFFAHRFSGWFWSHPGVSWIDFPWRLLGPLTFFLSLCSLFLTFHFWGRLVGIFLLMIAISFHISLLSPVAFLHTPDSYYETNDATTTSNDELLPLWVRKKPTNRYEKKVDVLQGNAEVSNVLTTSYSFSFSVQTPHDATIRINTIYFPGWVILVDGEEASVDYSNPYGVMDVTVGRGVHTIVGAFRDTPVRRIANVISLLSLGIAGFISLFALIGARRRYL